MVASVRSSVGLLSVVIVALATCVSCGPSEEIDSYQIERTAPPREPFVAEEVANELHRMLTAMLPMDDQVYFFKLVGKKPVVDRHRVEFEKFVASVAKAEAASQSFTWKLPEGWSEEGASEMRINTITVPDDAGDLEIAISSLPMSGTWDDFVADNVNRWLNQLSQSALPRQTILNLTRQVKTKAGAATVVELAGVMQDTTLTMNPHAGVTPSRSEAQTPRGPAIDPPGSASGMISYEAPASWQAGPPAPMREATYFVGEGDSRAEFSLSGWPAAGGTQMADVMANVERWAGQVGVPGDEDLSSLVEEIDIGGGKGSYVKLVGPNSGQTMLAAMVVYGDKVWFFKLTGPAEVVTRETENFRKFVESVKFN